VKALASLIISEEINTVMEKVAKITQVMNNVGPKSKNN